MNWRAFSTVFIVLGGLCAALAGWQWQHTAEWNNSAASFNGQLTGLAASYGIPERSTTVWMVLTVVGAVVFVVGVAVFVSFRRSTET